MNRRSPFALFILTIIFTFCFTASHLVASKGEKSASYDENSILQVMQQFQDGYTKRDTSIINEYAQELFSPDIFIIGTGSSEWLQGINAAKKLVELDWERWGDLKIDIEKLDLSVQDDICWFAAPGTLTYNFESEDYIYQRYGLNDINRIINQDKSNKAKLLSIIQDASDLLFEVEVAGTKFKYPIRLAGTLIKIDGYWKFRQMIFSYPYPRNLIVDKNE